jgi:hypothetical protein
MFVAALLVKEEMIRVTDILPHVRFIFLALASLCPLIYLCAAGT